MDEEPMYAEDLLALDVYESNNGVRPEDGPQTEDDGSPLRAPIDDESAGEATKLVNFALSFLGYHEGSGNDNKFSAYFHRNFEAWCQDFDTYIAILCGFFHLNTGYTVDCVLDARDRGTWHDGIAGISKGDSVYYHWPESSRPSNWPDHVETFTGDFLSDGGIKTVGGNVNDSVAIKARRSNILGYIRHPFDAGQGNPKPVPPPTYFVQTWFVADDDNPWAHVMTNRAVKLGGIVGKTVQSSKFDGKVAWLAVGRYPAMRSLVLLGRSVKLPMESRRVLGTTPGMDATLVAIKKGKL